MDLLKCIKDDANLRRLPVMMMSTANVPDEVRSCDAAGANAFIVKPVEYQHVEQLYTRLLAFWSQEHVRLPGRPVHAEQSTLESQAWN